MIYPNKNLNRPFYALSGHRESLFNVIANLPKKYGYISLHFIPSYLR